ncbi:IS3 family transposase [Streptomyces sp. NPDC002133]|uniref:IS3 family transposase n=1 Tax=Streptomyces sp. NPDC002133 TaxID=3154409 RepID=UPI00331FB351
MTESGYFTWRSRPASARSVRHSRLTEVITAIHSASHGTYGYRRIHDELTLRYGIAVSHGTVQLLMRRAGIQGLSGDKRRRDRGGGRVPPDAGPPA